MVNRPEQFFTHANSHVHHVLSEQESDFTWGTAPTAGNLRAVIKTAESNNKHSFDPHPSGHCSSHQHPSVSNQLPFWGYERSPIPSCHHSCTYPKSSSTVTMGIDRLLPENQHQISPPPGLVAPSKQINETSIGYQMRPFAYRCSHSPPSINDLASELDNIRVSPTPSHSPSSPWSTEIAAWENDDDDSEDDVSPSHPNKFAVEIEHHENKFCSYKRQPTRSGEKIKQRLITSYNPITLEPQTSLQQTKYYQKHLVRICKCGAYQGMDGVLPQGKANDCNGYEIHYSQKCRWKAYDDFKTGKRVLIRLCKCYKPA